MQQSLANRQQYLDDVFRLMARFGCNYSKTFLIMGVNEIQFKDTVKTLERNSIQRHCQNTCTPWPHALSKDTVKTLVHLGPMHSLKTLSKH